MRKGRLKSQINISFFLGIFFGLIFILLPRIYNGWHLTWFTDADIMSHFPNPFINLPTNILVSLEIAIFTGFVCFSRLRFKYVDSYLTSISSLFYKIATKHKITDESAGTNLQITNPSFNHDGTAPCLTPIQIKPTDKLDDVDNFLKNNSVFKEDEILKQLWESYKLCIPAYKYRNEKKEIPFGSTAEPSQFFNWETLVVGRYDVAIFNLIPSILTGLGITGTFYGIITGLAGMDVTSSGGLTNGAGQLINAMQTAFVASFYGITLSLIYSYINKYFVNRLQGSVREVPHQIDCLIPEKITSQYLLLSVKEKNYDMARCLQTLTDDDNGLSQRMARKLNDLLSGQFGALNHVLGQLSGMDTGRLSQVMGERVGQSIESEFGKLKGSIEQFQQWQSESFTQFRETIEQQRNIVQSQHTLIENIYKTLGQTSTITNDLENACGTIIQTLNSLTPAIDAVSKVSQSLGIELPRLQETTKMNISATQQIAEAWNSSGDSFIKAHENLAERLRAYNAQVANDIDGFTGKFDSAMANAISIFNSTLSEMGDTSIDMKNTATESMTLFKEWLGEIHGGFNIQHTKMNDVLAGITTLLAEFEKSLANLNQKQQIIP